MFSPKIARIEVTMEQVEVELADVGLQGPPGPAGLSYTHTQSTTATTWVVNHNLGFRPNVEVSDLGGMDISTGVEILHVSLNQVQILANQPLAGLVRCN